MTFYYIVVIMAGLATVAGVLHQVTRKTVRESAKSVAESTTAVLTDALAEVRKDRDLTTSVEGYNSVLAANRALRQVIDDSSTQLAQAAMQLASNSEVLSKVRLDLAKCQDDKTDLLERIASLEARVRLLARDLASFTETGRSRDTLG